MPKVRIFPISQYVNAALAMAEYERDENGVVIALVPDASGFFAQGDNFEEARRNLQDVIEGNIALALQLNLPLPAIKGVVIEERDAQTIAA